MKIKLGIVASVMLTTGVSAGGYVGAYGGANWDDVIPSKYVSENTGFVVGGVIGMPVKSVPGLRIELDLNHRQNEVDVFGGKINVDHETTAVLGNVVYDFATPNWPVHPYVLAGVGVAQTRGTFEDIALARVEATGLAWQLGVGANTEVADGVVFGVGYRYFQAPEIEVFGTDLSDGSNHAVVAELKFAL